MSAKKGGKAAKQKNTRHHFDTAQSIGKKKSKKAKLRNTSLRGHLDQMTGLAGASGLFVSKSGSATAAKQKQEREMQEKMDLEMGKLESMKL
jgi:hypothetical protein